MTKIGKGNDTEKLYIYNLSYVSNIICFRQLMNNNISLCFYYFECKARRAKLALEFRIVKITHQLTNFTEELAYMKNK